MTATQAGPDTDRQPAAPNRSRQSQRPVVRAQRDTAYVPVQRRAPVKLAAEPRPEFPFAAAIRAIAMPALLLIAVIAQLTIVNRLPLPGGTGPDLVLLTVTAIAVCTGPLAGTLAGFCGGLALDIAPPAAHYVGEYALVFCLAGWAAGRVRRALTDATGERDQLTTLTVMAAATVAGEAGKAAIGLLLSDPAVTGPVVDRVLPAAILYDLLLSPAVLWLVGRAAVGPRPVHAPRPDFGPAGQLAGVFRQASAGAAPNLRLAGSGGIRQQQSLPRLVPNLRLSRTSSSGMHRTNGVSPQPAQLRRSGGRAPRLNFAGDHPSPASRQLATPGKGWLQTARAMTPQAGLRQLRTPGKGWIHAVGRMAPRAGAATMAGRRGPAKGWLRPARPAAPARRRTPAKGWLRPAKPPRLNWYTRGPSTRWLRRSRTTAWSRARWFGKQRFGKQRFGKQRFGKPKKGGRW